MAYITRKFEVCNVCLDVDRPVESGFVLGITGEGTRRVSLCEEHRQMPFVELLKVLGATPPGRRARPPVTLTHIAKVKAKRKTAAK